MRRASASVFVFGISGLAALGCSSSSVDPPAPAPLGHYRGAGASNGSVALLDIDVATPGASGVATVTGRLLVDGHGAGLLEGTSTSHQILLTGSPAAPLPADLVGTPSLGHIDVVVRTAGDTLTFPIFGGAGRSVAVHCQEKEPLRNYVVVVADTEVVLAAPLRDFALVAFGTRIGDALEITEFPRQGYGFTGTRAFDTITAKLTRYGAGPESTLTTSWCP